VLSSAVSDRAHFLTGLFHLNISNPNEAKVSFQNALSKNETMTSAMVGLGWVMMEDMVCKNNTWFDKALDVSENDLEASFFN
jgi:hypothetical protein